MMHRSTRSRLGPGCPSCQRARTTVTGVILGSVAVLAWALSLGACHRQEPVAGSAGTVHWPDETGFIIVPITINDQEMHAVVDSGYSESLTIPEDEVRRMHLPHTDAPVQQTTDMAGNIKEHRLLPAITLGIGTWHQTISLATATMEEWSRLGGGWLTENHAVIDFQRRLLAWPHTGDPGALVGYAAKPLSSRGHHRVPCRSEHGLLLARASLASETLTFLVDTGTDETIIDEGVARKLGLRVDPQDRKQLRLSKQLVISVPRCGSQLLSFDTMTVRCDHLLVLDLRACNALTDKRGMTRLDGIIGTDVLMRYGAILNYHDLTFHLREP